MATDISTFYIANCIKRIMDAECITRNINRRAEDVAEGVRLASVEGLEVAHKYLVRLCKDAESGKYTR